MPGQRKIAKQLTKAQAVASLAGSSSFTARWDDKWKYPSTGDDQQTSPMLDFMFQVEQRGGGTLIFIPDRR